MALQKNVGGWDRFVRALLGVPLVAGAAVAVVGGYTVVGIGAGLAGAGLLFNAATQFCGVNALLGIDTCSQK